MATTTTNESTKIEEAARAVAKPEVSRRRMLWLGTLAAGGLALLTACGGEGDDDDDDDDDDD